jgi:hypothetical protein
MLRNPVFATVFVTLYLVTYHIFFQIGVHQDIIMLMFGASPFLVIWMVITILKYGKYSGPECNDTTNGEVD